MFLCKTLVQLLGGDIYLDESYVSDIAECTGCRFVIDLKIAPVDLECNKDRNCLLGPSGAMLGQLGVADHSIKDSFPQISHTELPEIISVLFVDDDPVLRKLFTRAIKRIAPKWNVSEASNGETALQLVTIDMARFDLIFMDMYMAAVEKQMLGTECVKAMRQRGVTSRI